MKRVFFLLTSLFFAVISYAQSLEMSIVVPTAPVLIVDELRVIGTGTNDLSKINSLNLGLLPSTEDSTRPFQEQKIVVGGTTQLGKISSGRDLFIENPIFITAIRLNQGNLFTSVPTFTIVKAGDFIAKTITGPTTQSNLKLSSKLSAQTIEIDGATMTISKDKGNKIKLAPLSTGAAISQVAEQNKQHIYYPWQSSQPSGLSQCNSNGDLCTKDACSVCASGSPTTECYDKRTESIADSYAKAGATYQKIGTAKFYCKPVEVYNNENTLDTATSENPGRSKCYQFMSYFGKNPTNNNNIELVEGFTSQITVSGNEYSRPETLTTSSNPFVNLTTNNNLVSPTDLGQACYSLCSSNDSGCSDTMEFYVALSNGSVKNFSSIFASSDFCSNSQSVWPIGSGLSCLAKEEIVDVYLLRCYQGSGAKTGGTIDQYRKVKCRQYSTVNNEYNSVVNSNTDGDKFLTLSAYFNSEFGE